MRTTNHRDRLIEGALECLTTKGYARTTARDLVAASGTNLGSIGYHFGSKEELMVEAMRVGFERWSDEVEHATRAPEHATGWERASAAIVATAATFKRHRALMVAFVEALAQVEHSPALRRDLTRYYEDMREHIASALAPVLGGEAHARTAASLFIAILDGLILQWLIAPRRAPKSEELESLLAVLSPQRAAPAPPPRA